MVMVQRLTRRSWEKHMKRQLLLRCLNKQVLPSSIPFYTFSIHVDTYIVFFFLKMLGLGRRENVLGQRLIKMVPHGSSKIKSSSATKKFKSPEKMSTMTKTSNDLPAFRCMSFFFGFDILMLYLLEKNGDFCWSCSQKYEFSISNLGIFRHS